MNYHKWLYRTLLSIRHRLNRWIAAERAKAFPRTINMRDITNLAVENIRENNLVITTVKLGKGESQ